MALKPETVARIQKELQGLGPEQQQKRLQEIIKELPPEEVKELQKQQCPFCSMASGKVDTNKIFEDDRFMAVLDINPATRGHVVLFPKEHRVVLFDMTDEEIGDMFKIANRLSNASHDGLDSGGTNIYVALGEVAGQRLDHLFVHIIPRFKDDGVSFGWNPKKIEDSEMKKISEDIRANLKFEKPKLKEVKKEKKKSSRKKRMRVA